MSPAVAASLALAVALAGCATRGAASDPEPGGALRSSGAGADPALAARLDAVVVERLADLDAAIARTERGMLLPDRRVGMPLAPARTGAPPAPVQITYVYELACKYCRDARAVLAELAARYGDRIAIVQRSYLVHRVPALTAHLVACAGERRGQTGALKEAIFDRALPAADFSSEHLLQIARGVGLAPDAVVAAATSATCYAPIRADHLLGVRAGVRGTPTFFVNGIAVQGLSNGVADLAGPIDAELARADAFVAAGGDLQRFHAAWLAQARPL